MYVIPPQVKETHAYMQWDNCFFEEELDLLQDIAKGANQNATVGNSVESKEDLSVRRSVLSWLTPTDSNLWVYQKLSGIVSRMNADSYNFDLTGFGEDIQLASYGEDRQGMYSWHKDMLEQGISRKLSLVLQLSNPDDYEGGELQILDRKDPMTVEKKRGKICIFPSWTLHQVTPVTKGNRQSLVAWVSGPPFK
jgi:PKHD-type hydroxylase